MAAAACGPQSLLSEYGGQGLARGAVEGVVDNLRVVDGLPLRRLEVTTGAFDEVLRLIWVRGHLLQVPLSQHLLEQAPTLGPGHESGSARRTRTNGRRFTSRRNGSSAELHRGDVTIVVFTGRPRRRWARSAAS